MNEIRPKITIEEIRNWHVSNAGANTEAATAV